MSVTSGPNSVTDSIVTYFDVANRLCFRGEPTTNLMRLESDYTGTAYAPSDEWSGTVLKKIYDPAIITPIGSGATIIMESGGTGWHQLSRIGGGLSGNFCISAYIKPITNDISNIDIGLLADSTNTVNFNLNTRQITYNNANTPRVAFIEDVREYPGWLRVGANVFGRSGGWVGSIGYNVNSYTGSVSGKQMYITGLQYEEGVIAPTRYLKPQTTRGTTVATGGGLVDISENDYHAEFVNGAGYNKSNGGSITFDGVDDYIVGVLQLLPLNGNVTIEAVFRLNNTSGYKNIFTQGQSGSTFSCGMVVIGSELKFRNSSNDYSFSSPITLSSNQWYHCVLSIDSNGTSGYINGNSIGTTVQKITSNSFTTYNIGRRPSTSSEFMNGDISLIKIYNKTLTANEVRRNFNALRGRFGI